jgi:acetyltransferase
MADMTQPRPRGDRSFDVAGVTTRRRLEAFFEPRTVAVIGASEERGSVGRTLLWNLVTNPFGGTVYPVNPRHRSILGIPALASVGQVPEPVDLAVIATPSRTVPGIIRECVEAGVRAAVVISAGFKEAGPHGAELERELVEEARKGPLPVIGPNCLGLMNPRTGLNATFATRAATPGRIALLSQSGAIATAILDWSVTARVGFSAFVSVGSMADVGWGDLIDHLGTDRHTQSILMYMESVGDAPAFLSAVREVALAKPVIIIKPGRTEEAARAASSHTGALTGSDEVLDAAFRRVGALRVDSIEDLFSMAQALALQPTPSGPRLAVVTNAGGPGVLATDAAIAAGAKLPPPPEAVLEALNGFLPRPWSHGNPYDILGDAGPERYVETLKVVAADDGNDGVLVVLTPQAMTNPTRTAEEVSRIELPRGKPMLASWMGGSDVAAGREALASGGIPAFDYPDDAARIFALMSRYGDQLRVLYETPEAVDPVITGGRAQEAAERLERLRLEGRKFLNEQESKDLLAAYGIPTVPTVTAATAEEAVAKANEFGYPVAVKLNSDTITHKSDVGGVKLDLADPEAVREAFRAIKRSVTEKVGTEHFQGVTVQPFVKHAGYELIVGSSVDSQFGPVLLFGAGGVLVELVRAYALDLPPLTTTLARRLIAQTPVAKMLPGLRGGAPIDPAPLEALLVRFSQLVVDQPAIAEIEINPLLIGPGELVALDARVVLHPAEVPAARLPRPAIRPYPAQYVEQVEIGGVPLTIRPIRPEDEPLVVDFHRRLSAQTVYLRYLSGIPLQRRIAHERLTRICFTDYSRQMALVAETREGGDRRLAAIGRLTKLPPNLDEAEFGLLVADDYQGKGIGLEILQRLVAIGRDEGLRRINADMLEENHRMKAIASKLGFRLRATGLGVLRAELDLQPGPAA